MLIQIEKPIKEYPKQNLIGLALLKIFPCLFILILLFVCEIFYLNKISVEKNTTYLGGGFFYSGLIILIVWLFKLKKSQSAINAVKLPQNLTAYLKLDDVGVERGVKNLWSETQNWQIFSGFEENEKAFMLRFALCQDAYPIFKYEFQNSEDINEFRIFLKTRFSEK